MRNFTKVKFWLLLMVMGLVVSSAVAQTGPKLAITPNTVDLGEWPIGGWQENVNMELTNIGTGIVEVTESDLDDPDNVFDLTNPTLPANISPLDPATLVGVAFNADGVAEGVYNATYVANWGAGKSVTTADISATAYAPVVGDIFENPFVVALPYNNAGVSTALPMRSNYNVAGASANGKDVVYKFTLAEDNEVSINITAATETPAMAVYAADFNGEAGPMSDNALFSAGASATDLPLFAGDYYLVVAADAADAAMTFDIEITASVMPEPECIVNPTPADGAVEVPSNGLVLSWEYGQYAMEYQLMFGTDYPPTEELMAWTEINPLGDSYALPNLDPSMQYFWQVNVRNNNHEVECDIYGFTTTLTPPADLTATVIENAEDDYDVELNWTASEKSLLSYNVYRDANLIATTQAGVNTYTDEDLAYNMNPCYIYTVEAVFDEGVSELSNEATACITGVGTLNGTVTALLTGEPIEGAVIDIVGGRTYQATTDANGEYSIEVLEGDYDLTASATDYITETRDDVEVDYNTTTTEDFELDEFPYPVNDVVAYEINENTVQVDWGNNGGGGGTPVAEWMFYDDGTNVDGIGGPATFTWAIKFDAEQLVDFADCFVSKYELYVRTSETFTFTIMQGDNAENVIYTEDISGLTMDAWNEVELATAVAFDNTQDLWIGVYSTNGANFPAAVGADMGEPNSDLITLDGTVWEHLSDYSLDGSWNLRAFVTNASGKSMNISKVDAPEYKADDNTAFAAAHVAPTGNATISKVANSSDKDLMGYNVYRQVCNEATPMEFIGMTLDDQFTDNTWGTVDWGTYKWAVEVIYTNNVSEVAYSNCLDKDMETTVGVDVSLNSGDTPEGTYVLFTNTSEPELELTYELELDGTGVAGIDPFRKGVYSYEVMLDGYAPIAAADVLIGTDTVFVWQLEELIAPPSDLYVTPTGFATWGGSGSIPFEPFMENFDSESNFDMWEVVVGGSTSDTWFWNDGTNGQYAETLDGTPYAFVDSDDAGSGTNMDELLISPVIDASNAEELIIEFDQFYNNLSSSELADVEVFDGNDWVTVLHQTSDAGAWSAPDHVVIDVTEYANADFRLRFHYLAPGWDWHWAVDNVHVHDNSGKYAGNKAFQFYKIWHDGVFSNDVDTNFYQYGTNTEIDILVPGETYLAEVASLYSTGLSAKVDYEWTYLPCDSFPGPNVVTATVDNDDVEVVWSDALPMELIEINQGYGAPSNGYFQSFGMVYGVAYDFSSYPDALVNAVDFHHASWGVTGTWDYMIHIVNRDDNTIIASVGPIQTTGNDIWEEMVELGDVATNGATEVAILMEPMGNDAADAYPDLSSDDAADPQGSIYGDFSDLAGLGASTIGNFLMNVHIYTANGGKMATPVVMNNIEGPAATARVANNNTFNPSQIVMQQEVSDKADKAVATVVGTNVYRNGEMIAFVAEPDTFYIDNNLEAGYYDYCVATVYTLDGGLHTFTSCLGTTCAEAMIGEDCNAPENLVVLDESGNGTIAELIWDAPNAFDPVWLQYDDGVNVDGIGGPAEFTYAVKWDPSQLEGFDGTAITKVKFFPREPGSSFTLKVWKGANAGTLVHEQPLTGLTFEDWNEVELTTPVEIDAADELWVGFYTVSSGYPAGCGNFTGNSNSDFITLDGAVWEHLADYSLPYSWNLGAYVEAAKGEIVELPVVVDHATYNSTDANVVAGNLAPAANAIDPFVGERALTGYNVYRDGEMINEELVLETTYIDELPHETATYCYEVTAVYSVCGESDPSNEVCHEFFVGLNEIENSVAVYPNPAKDFVQVDASQNIRSIEVTNYMGQVVEAVKAVETPNFRINTSNYSSGVYFVEVETAAGIEKVRIVIAE